MKYLLSISLLIAFLALSTDAEAQRRQHRRSSTKEKKEETKSPLDNFTVGTYLNLGYSRGWNIGVSPQIGYELIPNRLQVGTGLEYTYQNFIYADRSETEFSTIGPRVFAQGRIFQNYYALVEYQRLTYRREEVDRIGNPIPGTEQRQNDSPVFLGLGIASPNFLDGFTLQTEFLYDVTYEEYVSPRSSPFNFRFGVFYSF